MDDLIQEFLVESNENLDRLDVELVKLEAEPHSQDLLASIFRTIHSIKGACGFLGFQKLEVLAHAGESLLSKLRDGELVLTPEIGSALLAMVDAIRGMLDSIARSGKDGDAVHAELIDRLKKLQGASAIENPKNAESPAPLADEKTSEQVREPSQGATVGRENLASATNVEKRASKPRDRRRAARTKHSPHAGKLGGALVEQNRVTPEDLAGALEAQESSDRRPIQALVSNGLLKAEALSETPGLIDDSKTKGAVQEQTIRVHVDLLDRLMTLVGELVLRGTSCSSFRTGLQKTGSKRSRKEST